MVKITRREMAAALAACAAPLLAESPSSQRQSGPDQALAAQRRDLRDAVERLQKLALPMAAEPVFVFRP